MVRTENDVVRAVYAAKTDPAAADAFVEQYMPFVRSETVKFTRAAIEAGHEDELSVALLPSMRQFCTMSRAAARFSPLRRAPSATA